MHVTIKADGVDVDLEVSDALLPRLMSVLLTGGYRHDLPTDHHSQPDQGADKTI